MAGKRREVTFQLLIDEGLLEIGDGYRAQNNELGGSGPIFLRAGHVTDSHIDFTGVERFHEHLAGKVRSKMSKVGDTIITTKGNSTGRTSFVTNMIPPFVYSPHLSYWRTRNPDKLCGGFLRYWSQSAEFIAQLSGMKASTDMAPYLSLTDQRRLSITLPPFPEQKAIAAVLGLFDDQIEVLRKNNATLESMAHALFKSWFVDFDPVRARVDGRQPTGMDAATSELFPSRFEDSALGQIPAGWVIRPIREMVQGVFDGPHATPPDVTSGPIFLGIGNFTGTNLDLAKVNHISEADWPRWTKRVTPRGGDIVFTYEATLGRFAIIPPWLRCCLGRRTALIRPNAGRDDGHFLFHWFTGHSFQEFLTSRIHPGATVDRILLSDFPDYPVLCPPASLMARFDTVASMHWQAIHAGMREALDLKSLRDTLLPKLLSGELTPPALAEGISP